MEVCGLKGADDHETNPERLAHGGGYRHLIDRIKNPINGWERRNPFDGFGLSALNQTMFAKD